jgi:hypothetical protein
VPSNGRSSTGTRCGLEPPEPSRYKRHFSFTEAHPQMFDKSRICQLQRTAHCRRPIHPAIVSDLRRAIHRVPAILPPARRVREMARTGCLPSDRSRCMRPILQQVQAITSMPVCSRKRFHHGDGSVVSVSDAVGAVAGSGHSPADLDGHLQPSPRLLAATPSSTRIRRVFVAIR